MNHQMLKIGSGLFLAVIGSIVIGTGIDEIQEAAFNRGWLEASPDSWLEADLKDLINKPTAEEIAEHRAGDFRDLTTQEMRGYARQFSGGILAGAGIWQISRR